MKNIINLITALIKICKRNKLAVNQVVDLNIYGYNTQIKIVASDFNSRCYKVQWLDDKRISFQTKDFINKFIVT
jgi:hydroxymethylpyrimidine/phosphomethylpyrimidine kinase